MMRKGIATKVSAITTPAVVNGRVMPNVESSQEPTSPRLPKASSSAIPPTTGGRTMGSVVSARSRLRPRNSTLAKTHASGTPKTSAITVADSEATSDSLRASTVSGAVRALIASPQGDRTIRPSRGRMKKAAPIAARIPTAIGTRSRLTGGSGGRQEAERLQHRLAIRGQNVGDEGVGDVQVWGPLDRDDGVGGDHIDRVRDRDAGHRAARGHDVGDVDNARIRLAKLDLADHRLHIGLQALRSHLHTCRGQALKGVLAGRNRSRLGDVNDARFGKVGQSGDVLGIAGADHDLELVVREHLRVSRRKAIGRELVHVRRVS